MQKVLILGGGFAGIDTAIHLRKNGYEVTLVSDREFFYIYPTSIWIPTGKSSFEKSCIDLKALQKAHGFELVIDGVSAIAAQSKEVKLQSGRVMSGYDSLVVAMGAGKMKHPGIENTLSISGAPEDSLAIRARIKALVEKGSGKIAFGFGGNPKDTSAVRGGPAFEMLFNVDAMLRKKGIRHNFELIMFAPMPKPGARLGEKSLAMMEKMFERAGARKSFGKKIKSFEADGITFEDESRVESDFTMFIPAGNGHEVIIASDLPQNDAGFVMINDFCEVAGCEDIYAVGDSAALEGPEWRAKQGHLAEVMAKNTAFNIMAKQKRLPARKGYAEHLNILCIMDSGDGAGFVYRDDKKAFIIPLPIVGHWLKRLWGEYCRLSKLGKFPRLPGM